MYLNVIAKTLVAAAGAAVPKGKGYPKGGKKKTGHKKKKKR